jgi:hypothetical protein
MGPVPEVRFRSLRGRELRFRYGEPVDDAKWKLFEGPYLNAERGSRRLTLTHGELRRVIDFSDLSVTDQPISLK